MCGARMLKAKVGDGSGCIAVLAAGPAGGLEGARVRHQQMVEAVEQAHMLKAKVSVKLSLIVQSFDASTHAEGKGLV